MIDLKIIDDVKALQLDLRASLGTPQGKEVISFLEGFCKWYDFMETNPNILLIYEGRRQVLATIKTLLDHPAETIVALTNKEQ